MEIMKTFSSCPLLEKPPEETSLLILEGLQTFGRTGNNLIEILHALQYGFDKNVVVAIKHGTLLFLVFFTRSTEIMRM